MARLVLARVVDPVTAQQVVGIITGMGGSEMAGIFSARFSLMFRDRRGVSVGINLLKMQTPFSGEQFLLSVAT